MAGITEGRECVVYISGRYAHGFYRRLRTEEADSIVGGAADRYI